MPGRAKVNGLIVRVSGVLAVGRSGDQFARGGDRWPRQDAAIASVRRQRQPCEDVDDAGESG